MIATRLNKRCNQEQTSKYMYYHTCDMLMIYDWVLGYGLFQCNQLGNMVLYYNVHSKLIIYCPLCPDNCDYSACTYIASKHTRFVSIICILNYKKY